MRELRIDPRDPSGQRGTKQLQRVFADCLKKKKKKMEQSGPSESTANLDGQYKRTKSIDAIR